MAKYRTTLFSYSVTIERNFIMRIMFSLKPRTKQAPICFMLICAIFSHILIDNQAAFNVNYIQPNITKISGLILLLVVCCLQVLWVYIYCRYLTQLISLCKFDIRPKLSQLNTFTCNIRNRRLKKQTKKKVNVTKKFQISMITGQFYKRLWFK